MALALRVMLRMFKFVPNKFVATLAHCTVLWFPSYLQYQAMSTNLLAALHDARPSGHAAHVQICSRQICRHSGTLYCAFLVTRESDVC